MIYRDCELRYIANVQAKSRIIKTVDGPDIETILGISRAE